MATHINDIAIDLDNFTGYKGDGDRRISVNLAQLAGFPSYSRLEVTRATLGDTVLTIAPVRQKGVFMIDLGANQSILPSSPLAIINYILKDSTTSSEDLEGRLIINNLGFNISLPLVVIEYGGDNVDLQMDSTTLLDIYTMDPSGRAGEVVGFARCIKQNENSCGCSDAIREVKTQDVLELSLGGSFMLPPDPNVPDDVAFNGILKATAKLYFAQNSGSTAFEPGGTTGTAANKKISDVRKVSLDIMGAPADITNKARIRMHFALDDIDIMQIQEDAKCTPNADCRNKISAQLMITDDSELQNAFILADKFPAFISYKDEEAQTTIRIQLGLSGLNFNRNDFTSYGIGEISADITLILAKDGEGNITGYTINGSGSIFAEDVDPTQKLNIITISGSGTHNDTTIGDVQTVATNGTLTADITNVQNESKGQIVVDISTTYTLTTTSTATAWTMDGGITLNAYDASEALKSRIILTPHLDFTLDKSTEPKPYTLGASLDVKQYDENLVLDEEASSYQSLSSSGTAAAEGNKLSISGTASLSLPENSIEGITYSADSEFKDACIASQVEGTLSFKPNLQSGFWNVPDASQELLYVQKNGSGYKAGIAIIRPKADTNGTQLDIEIS